MKIQTKLSQNRRDFTAIYECESCGATKRDYGYDDNYFHSEVIPAMRCATCGATAAGATSTPDVQAGVVL